MSRTLALLVFGIMAAFFGCFFAYPIWTTVKLAFETPDHQLTLEFVFEVFRNHIYQEGLINSFLIAIWTTLGCLVMSIPLAVIFVRCLRSSGRSESKRSSAKPVLSTPPSSTLGG